jgi:uncharacterized membrane-anchored protein YhcB (DUF1043 family)
VMRRSNLYVGLYLFLVFVSGVLVGAIAYRLYSTEAVSATKSSARGSDDYRRQYLEEMRSRLKLRDDQVRQLDAILDATREEYHAIHQKLAPEMKAVQEEQVQKVLAMLNEAQRAEYQKMREERAKRKQQSTKKSGHAPAE